MRTFVALLLAGLMIAPPATALHDKPVTQAEQPSRAFREVIFDFNETLTSIEEQVGEDDPQLRQARAKLAGAGEAHNRASHWIALSRLLEATTLAHRAQVEYENRGASDEDAAYFADMENAWQQADSWITQLHRRMLELQSAGVDLYMLDHVLLASSILAKGERIHRAFSGLAQNWEKGQRGDQARNGLAAFSYGPIMYAQIADRIIDKAAKNSPEEPVGPVVGNNTLRGIMDALRPLVQNRSVSFDRDMSAIINGNVAEQEWLAALGASVAWSEKQASAAVQHRLDEPEDQFDPVNVTQHLEDLVESDETLQALDDLGVPGAQARFSLSHATASLRLSLNETESGQADQRTALKAAEGLGALSAAHTSQAILQLANGDDPPKQIIHLPTSSSGDLGLSDTEGNSTDAADESVLGSGWLWLAALGALIVAGAVWRRRTR